MEKKIKPSYYKDFSCIASACTDSCCIGWEIDIDEDTLEYYRTVAGDFGERLKKDIVWNRESDEELPHFRQGSKERCPFLNDCNLCDIFIHLGEEHLSQICTHHPRYYDWFLDREEGGLGLCCEEAARLMLTCQDPFTLEESLEEEGEPLEEVLASSEEEDFYDEDLLFDKELLEALLDQREAVFDLVRSFAARQVPLNQLLDQIWEMAGKQQESYDDLMYGKAEEEEEAKEPVSFSEWFWSEDHLRKVLAFYRGLEINDTLWWKTLLELEAHLKELLSSAKEAAILKERAEDLPRLLFYFLYRHYMKAREDDSIENHVAFALGSCAMIWLLDLNQIRKTGELTLWNQIELSKLYSKEIEYDEENTLRLGEFLGEELSAN